VSRESPERTISFVVVESIVQVGAPFILYLIMYPRQLIPGALQDKYILALVLNRTSALASYVTISGLSNIILSVTAVSYTKGGSTPYCANMFEENNPKTKINVVPNLIIVFMLK
jgi:hypothetical protein